MTSFVLVFQDLLTHSTALGTLLLPRESVVMDSKHHGGVLSHGAAVLCRYTALDQKTIHLDNQLCYFWLGCRISFNISTCLFSCIPGIWLDLHVSNSVIKGWREFPMRSSWGLSGLEEPLCSLQLPEEGKGRGRCWAGGDGSKLH